MEKKIRLGLLGIGHMHSHQKLDCAVARPDLFDIIGIAVPEDEDPETPCYKDGLTMYPQFPRMTLEQMLDSDADAILVETDDWLMPKYAVMCLEAGKHVHMDKPAGEDIPTFRRALSLSKRKHLTLQMAYMYRYNTAVMKAQEMVKEGRLGDILQVDAVMSTEHAPWIRQWLTRFQGGTMHTFGCHMLDLILLFQGMPEKVTPFLRQTSIGGLNLNDHDLAVLEYPHGLSTARVSSFEVNGFGRRQLVICGTEGTLELKPLETNHFLDMTPMTFAHKGLTKFEQYEDMHECIREAPMLNRHNLLLEDFARMVRGEKENPYTPEYEAQLQNVCLAACGFDVDLKERIIL